MRVLVELTHYHDGEAVEPADQGDLCAVVTERLGWGRMDLITEANTRWYSSPRAGERYRLTPIPTSETCKIEVYHGGLRAPTDA